MKFRSLSRPSTGHRWILFLGVLVGAPLYAAWQHPETPPNAPPSLKTVPVELPSNLNEAVQDLDAAKRLGKALFWDMQVGSDSASCATCHFHAGQDTRTKNQTNPGPGGFNLFFSGGHGPNYTPVACDFPFHKLEVPDDNDSAVVHDIDDRMSSAGVFRRRFDAVDVTPPLDAQDEGTIEPDPDGFAFPGQPNSKNVRRVEPRNTPTVINSILLHRIFFDGRANFNFNGNNPFGDTDPNAKVLVNNGNAGDDATPTRLLFDHAATASQSVGPPLSPFEMSYYGRIWPQLGRKMILRKPLALQRVAHDDSVLGVIDNQPDPGDVLPGLDPTLTYADMIRSAFHAKFWNAGNTYDADTGLPSAGAFSQMERNFALFFGLAILAYESDLVSDDSRYDQYMDGGGESGTAANALTAQEKEGLDIFLNRGGCIGCHFGPEFAGGTLTKIFRTPNEGLLERMLMADGEADGHAQFVSYPPPIGEPLHPTDSALLSDPRGKLIEIRPPTGYGGPLAWGWGYFATGAGVCTPAIDQTIVLTPGSNAPSNSNFSASARLRVDTDCSKVFRVDMSWQYPGAPGGEYTLYVAGRLVGRIHMDQVQPPAVYDNGFYNIGVRPTAEDIGNGGVGPFGPFAFAARAQSGENVDNGNLQPPVGPNERIAVNGAFKTPSLRNIELTGPYMHNGGFSTLEQIVDFYTGGAHFEQVNKHDLDPDVEGIGGMNPDRKAALVAFLKALTDERVRLEQGPFDHPELIVPVGHPGDQNGVTEGPNCNLALHVCEATENFLTVPPVGNGGRAANDALQPFETQLAPCVNLLLAGGARVSETGATISQVRVALSRRPASPVTVALQVSDTTEGTLTASALTFTPTNWSTPQIAVVRGVQDGIVDGSVPFNLAVASVTSTDPTFDGIPGNSVSITSIDSGVRYETFQFEAENGAITSPMVSALDSTASNGRYVWAPSGAGNNSSATGTLGVDALTFNVTAPGNYYVWGLVKTPTVNDNQFWAKMDSGTYFNWTMPVTTVWTWDKVNDTAAQDPILWNLTAGSHTLRIRWREDGTKLDRVIVTSDPAYVPQTGNPIAP
ncbi:MAG: hypothetical protein HZA53_12590 [Planctomycetes bacterium]|nr:hypothetical protein [Planctomycetota bacterium]